MFIVVKFRHNTSKHVMLRLIVGMFSISRIYLPNGKYCHVAMIRTLITNFKEFFISFSFQENI